MFSLHLVQNSSDGASGRQERRTGPTSQIPPEPTDGHPTDPAPQRGNHNSPQQRARPPATKTPTTLIERTHRFICFTAIKTAALLQRHFSQTERGIYMFKFMIHRCRTYITYVYLHPFICYLNCFSVKRRTGAGANRSCQGWEAGYPSSHRAIPSCVMYSQIYLVLTVTLWSLKKRIFNCEESNSPRLQMFCQTEAHRQPTVGLVWHST